MAEAIISRAGGDINISQLSQNILFSSNTTFIAPFSGNYLVEVSGGGGGGSGHRLLERGSSGGLGSAKPGWSGYFNMGSIYLNKGQKVSIIIGSGGAGGQANKYGSTGGTTSFGTYLSAIGGNGGNDTYYWADHVHCIANHTVQIPFCSGAMNNGVFSVGGNGGQPDSFQYSDTYNGDPSYCGKNGNSGFVTVRW